MGYGDDAAALAGGCLVQQPDGQAGVAGGVAFLSLSEDGGGFALGVGAQAEPGFAGQGGDDGRELVGV